MRLPLLLIPQFSISLLTRVIGRLYYQDSPFDFLVRFRSH